MTCLVGVNKCKGGSGDNQCRVAAESMTEDEEIVCRLF